MVKNKIIIILICLFIFNLVCCSQGKNMNSYNLKDNILSINNQLDVNLSDSIGNVLIKLGDQYSKRNIPGEIEYDLKKYPILIFCNNKTNKIETIILLFYNFDDNKEKYINEVTIEDIKIKNDSSFNEVKELFNNKNIKYSVDEVTISYDLSLHNNKILLIRFLKNDLLMPYEIGININ